MKLSTFALFIGLAGAAAGQEQLLVHDVRIITPELAKSVENFGLRALDPFASALDRVEVERRESEDMKQALDLDDGIDLRPLLEARSVPISDETMVAFSPSLRLVFFRAPWVEAELIQAFLSNERKAGWGENTVTGELWIYEAPVNQMELHGWRKKLSLADLESLSDVKLVRYEKRATNGFFNGEVEVLGPPTELERSERESFWGFGGAQRAADAHSTSWSMGLMEQWTRTNFRERGGGGVEGLTSFSSFAAPGEAQVIPIGFEPRPRPRRWVAVTRFGERDPSPTKAQRAAIRSWRGFNPPLESGAGVATAEPLGLTVLQAPRNLLEFADPNGLGLPLGYGPAQPFARSGVHPEIFGDREVFDLRPFFRIGGASFDENSEAWMAPNLDLVFLRTTQSDLSLIEPFFEKMTASEPGLRLQIDVGCWLGATPESRPTPDLAASVTADLSGSGRSSVESGIGSGRDLSWLENPKIETASKGLPSDLIFMAKGLAIEADCRQGDDGQLSVAFDLGAKFSAEGPVIFSGKDRDLSLADGQPHRLTLDDKLGSGQQLLVEIYPAVLRSDGSRLLEDDNVVKTWTRRWRAVFE